ncbi:zinc-ribbon domain-containing protein [Lachnospiraceae bacterium]|nr:zinc-ribbon domain-containing protein [Lachnospiraceae bacterium]
MGDINSNNRPSFCSKCGAKLSSSAAFCPKCGNKVSGSVAQNQIPTVNEPSGKSKVGSKTVLLPVIIVAVIVFVIVAVGGVLIAVNFDSIKENLFSSSVKKEAVIDDDDDHHGKDDEDEGSTEEYSDVSTESSEEYPADEKTDDTIADAGPLTESDIDMSELNMLFDVISYDPENISDKKGSFPWSFFCYSSQYRDRIASKYDVENKEWMTVMSVEDAKDLMLNSIGSDDLSEIEERVEGDYCYIKNGELYSTTPDTGDMWYGDAVITDYRITSDGDLWVSGYREEGCFTETWRHEIEAYFKKNPESVWSGLTLEYAYELNETHYLLPEAQTRNYYRDEVDFSAEYARLARNEIYARHGRIFKDQALQEYFDQQSWYEGTVEEVPETELNEYEKNNIELMASIEKEMQ